MESTSENGINGRTQTFTDRHGRKWDVTLTLASARRVDASDFSEIYSGDVCMLRPSRDLFQELVVNKPLAVAMVWAIVQPQATEREVSEDEFLESLDGSSVGECLEAFWETIAGFFPQARTVISKLRELQEKATALATAGLEKMSQRAQENLEKLIDEEFAKYDRDASEPSGEKSSPVSVA